MYTWSVHSRNNAKHKMTLPITIRGSNKIEKNMNKNSIKRKRRETQRNKNKMCIQNTLWSIRSNIIFGFVLTFVLIIYRLFYCKKKKTIDLFCLLLIFETALMLFDLLLRPTRSGHIEIGSITKRCYDSDASCNCCCTLILRFHSIRCTVFVYVYACAPYIYLNVFGCICVTMTKYYYTLSTVSFQFQSYVPSVYVFVYHSLP